MTGGWKVSTVKWIAGKLGRRFLNILCISGFKEICVYILWDFKVLYYWGHVSYIVYLVVKMLIGTVCFASDIRWYCIMSDSIWKNILLKLTLPNTKKNMNVSNKWI